MKPDVLQTVLVWLGIAIAAVCIALMFIMSQNILSSQQ
jgi:hypothetical protein